MHPLRSTLLLVGLATALLGALCSPVGPASAASRLCGLPALGSSSAEVAEPAAVNLDPVQVDRAIEYAMEHNRVSVQVFRNNCQVGHASLGNQTDHVALPLWSSTKSVVSLLTGIAWNQGKISLEDPIDRYLPTGPGWGDPAHRAITVRDLLTQSSGLTEAIASEGLTTSLDPHIAQQALALPLAQKPGDHFQYSQRAVDLLSFVVQRAVGEDLQSFAQRYLFGPIGIDGRDYAWLRDRSGVTYGYAHLMMSPKKYARLGLLLSNEGRWGGAQVVPERYIQLLQQPSPRNGCYGYLFWTNRGDSCTSASVPAAETVQHRMIPSAPSDLFAMVGLGHQNNFVIPSLNLVVTWIGFMGDSGPSIGAYLSAAPGSSDLYYKFFEILLKGVRDQELPTPEPFVPAPPDYDFDSRNVFDWALLTTNLFPNTNCNVFSCILP